MSVSKPFVFALVCDLLGAADVHAKLGANPTGLPFNSLEAVERSTDGRTNPMVNAGAIATTSLVPGDSVDDKWTSIVSGLARFAGRKLDLNDEVLASASATNYRNQAIARLLQSRNRIYCDPAEAVELYTRQCSLNITVHDLAIMGATLANGGVNPITKDSIVSGDSCHYTLAVMASSGMYETSGDWLYEVGLPGKSGIGGGIVMIGPGKGSLATFSPRLDEYGNSVRGQLAARFLSRSLGLGLFFSRDHISDGGS
jgi:glutaminase